MSFNLKEKMIVINNLVKYENSLKIDGLKDKKKGLLIKSTHN